MFAKGHGTQNDFVLLPDPDGTLTLTPAAVAALCDRRRGLGADGVLRVTTAGRRRRPACSTGCPRAWRRRLVHGLPQRRRRRIAQMCGNGVRVFAHYLRASGLESRDEFVVGSLAGPRPVVLHEWDDTTARRHRRDGQDQPARHRRGDRRRPAVRRPGRRRRQPAPGVRRPDLTLGRAGGARRRGAGVVRPRAVPRRRQRRGADGAGGRARCRCGYTSAVSGRRVRAAREPSPPSSPRWRTRARPPARCGCSIPGGEVAVTVTDATVTCAARRSWWPAASCRRTGGALPSR